MTFAYTTLGNVAAGRGRVQTSTRPTTLDEFITGLPWDESVTDSFDIGNGESGDFPVYFSPQMMIERNFHLGTFLDGELHFFPVGFSLAADENDTQKEPTTYHYTKKGIVKKNRKEGVLYLPLELSELEVTLDNHEGMFPIYSVRGARRNHPLLFVSRTNNGFKYTGLFRNKNGEVENFSYENIESPQWRRMWHQLHEGTYRPTPESKTTFLRTEENGIDWMVPRSISSFLDRHVIGQGHAKRTMAVAFSKYLAFVRTENPHLPRAHLLLIGPTGVGKTYLAKLLARKTGLPFTDTQLTGKSVEGYTGKMLSDALVPIAEKTTEASPTGIVVLNELDKLARDAWGTSTKGFGPRLQRELMGWLDGENVLLNYSEENKKRERRINTGNLLFITTGAFYGEKEEPSIQQIVAQRIRKEQAESREFGEARRDAHSKKSYGTYVQPQDLVAYGLMQELVGRFSGISVLHPLTTEQKIEILMYSEESVIRGYQELFREYGFELQFDDEALRVIAEASPEDIGARGLNGVCSELFDPIIFDPTNYASGKTIQLTARMARAFIQHSREQQPALYLV